MNTLGIAEYPAGAIKLDKFFGSAVKLLVDGKVFESHRLDIVFSYEADLVASIGKMVQFAMSDREAALRFMLSVIDSYKE